MTEKRKPTYDLDAFRQTFCTAASLNVTGTALRDAAALGFGRQEIVAVIQTMLPAHFSKSVCRKSGRGPLAPNNGGPEGEAPDHQPVPLRLPPKSTVVGGGGASSKAGTLSVKFTADVLTSFLLLSSQEKDNG